MSDEALIDKRAVRRSFEHAAARYNAHAVLQHEVCARMLERLEYIKLQPDVILDAGSGTGNAVPGLLARYRGATLVALDVAHAMLQRVHGRLKWWQTLPALRPPLHVVCGDVEALPIMTGGITLAWSNLALQWVNDLPRALRELFRILAPGGLLMFSTFGPDTLKELRRSYEGTDGRTHVSRFVDMHDIGDLLVHAGFADPVMDMEYVTLTYESPQALLAELKAIGATNRTRGRPRGLMGRGRFGRVSRALDNARVDGRIPATFEVVYGHAWKGEPRRTPDGHSIVRVQRKDRHR